MPADLEKARELFLHAVGKLPADEWERYVAEACGGDADLRRQAERLLRVHREAGSFLERPAPALWDIPGTPWTGRPARRPRTWLEVKAPARRSAPTSSSSRSARAVSASSSWPSSSGRSVARWR